MRRSRGYSHRNRSRSPLYTKFRREQRGYDGGGYDFDSSQTYQDRRRFMHAGNSYSADYDQSDGQYDNINDEYQYGSSNYYGEGTSSMGSNDFNCPDYSGYDMASPSAYPPSSVKSRLGNVQNYSDHSKRRQKLEVRMKEFVSEDVLVMELSDLSDLGHYSPIFVHCSALYIPRTDDSGYCDRLIDFPQLRAANFFKLGQIYNFEGEETEKDCILEWIALKVWPVDYSEPETNENCNSVQRDHFRVFLNKFDRDKLVFATLPTVSGSRMSQIHAHVSKIVSDKYGVIEIKGIGNSDNTFNCLFHYDSIWLENGENAKDTLGYTKVLGDLVHVGMDVNVSARSIIKYKGQDIVTSKLELQAILVFVRSYAMPACMPKATRIRGPPGSIGYSRRYTPYYFNSSLLYTLNNQLSEFINITKEIDPMVERSYLNPSVDLELLLNNKDRRLKRDSFGPLPSVRMDIVGAKGIIVSLFDEEDGGVIECIDGGERCYFYIDNLLLRQEDNFRNVCAFGTILTFNASLINYQLKVPYLVSKVWNEDHFPIQKHESNLNLFERFEHVNKNVGDDLLYPQNAENASGIVYRILDDNFGLLQWERNNKLILFDTCDLWLDDNCTADRVKKSLKDVIKVNQPLRFHAILINRDSKIPYLTSAVWYAENSKLTNYPPFVERSQIHSKKISIYDVVLKSVVGKLFPKGVNEMTGRISTIFTVDNIPVAGLIVSDEDKTKKFFEINGALQNFPPDRKVKYLQKSVSGCPIGIKVSTLESNLDSSYDESSVGRAFDKWTELNLSPDIFSRDLPPFFEVDIESNHKDETSSATLVCMINEQGGILRNDFDPRKLCYFELEDINFESLNNSLTLKDIANVLGKEVPGVKVSYQSTKPNDCHPEDPIQYISNLRGVQVVITSPSLSYLKLTEPKKSYMSDLGTSKVNRWRFANKAYNKNEVLNLETILQRDFSDSMTPTTSDSSSFDLPGMIIASRGRVRHILNENFGLVQDVRSGAYCLFDTYDLYVSPRVSAAETNKSVAEVVKPGDEVIFNATLVRNTKMVPYLVTGIWDVQLQDEMTYIHPVSLEAIQNDKINVYDTVSDSCVKILQMRSNKIRNEVDTRQILERKKYIQKAYDSESYIKYTSSLPKEHRSPRDPRTPDPENCDEDPDDLIRWRENIVDWLSDQLNRSSYNSTSSKSLNRYDPEILYDDETTGRLYTTDDSCEYGIVRLDNGAKALLHRGRVWLTTRPLRYNTGLEILLWKEQFRQIHVKARRLSPTLQTECGCEYQVIYCHAGSKTPRRGVKFDYGSRMLSWMNSLSSGTVMDRELDSYIRFLIDTRKKR